MDRGVFEYRSPAQSGLFYYAADFCAAPPPNQSNEQMADRHGPPSAGSGRPRRVDVSLACASALDTLKPAMDALKDDLSKPHELAALKLAIDAIKNVIGLIEAYGDTVAGNVPCCPRPKKTKAAPKRGLIRAKMINDFENGTTTPEKLEGLDRKILMSRYGDGAGRTTVVDALNEARRAWDPDKSRQTTNRDI